MAPWRSMPDSPAGRRSWTSTAGPGPSPFSSRAAPGQVIGLEIAESAVADARRNCRENGIGNCRFLGGDVRETLSGLDGPADVMVIDPPRAGMHRDVLAEVLGLECRRVVYVSCNPATLARDLAEMRDAYEVLEIQPVDLFPHTHHIEAVARLERKAVQVQVDV